jgi:hypothetical protein
MEYKEIDWERPFSPAYGVVRIPSNLILYRGYDTQYPSVSNKPAYFSGKEIAIGYAKKNNRELGIFTNTRELKLLDIRFMKTLLRELFDTNYKSDNSSLAITLSFGLCSLYHQLILAKERFKENLPEGLKVLNATYKNTFYEQPGVRIAETSNDAESMGFLSTIFKGFVDGFVAPRIPTAFHYEKGGSMSPELVIFNPEASSIKQLQNTTTGPPIKIPTISFAEIFISQFGKTVNIEFNNSSLSFHIAQSQRGGKNDTSLPSVEAISEHLHTNPIIRGLFERGVKAATKWKRNNSFYEVEAPSPTVKISPFSEENFQKNTLTTHRRSSPL